jgi:hypothetical protein
MQPGQALASGPWFHIGNMQGLINFIQAPQWSDQLSMYRVSQRTTSVRHLANLLAVPSVQPHVVLRFFVPSFPGLTYSVHRYPARG